MTVTPDTVVVGVEPDIPWGKFASVLQDARSPAASTAVAGRAAVIDTGVSPAFALAIFKHESRYGIAGLVPKYDLKNPGATRSIRTGNGQVIDIPGRGEFVRYATWADGWSDLAFRLVDPTYVYAREGRRTIRQIIERWAPSSDGNVPESYIAAVVRSMNEWIEPEMATGQQRYTEGDDPRFEWLPELANEFGYPQEGTFGRGGEQIELLVIHITVGTDSLAHLRNANRNSAHYLTDRMFRPRAQMVRDQDAAWTGGNREYNERGIHVELENRPSDPISDEMHRNAARTIAPVLKRHNIPPIFLGRDNRRGKRGIIGHIHIPDPDGTGWGGSDNHTDPDANPTWNWPTFMAYIEAEMNPEQEAIIEGYRVSGAILTAYRQLERDGEHWWTTGIPVAEAVDGVLVDGIARTVQQFDRAPWVMTENDGVVIAKPDQVRQIEAALDLPNDRDTIIEGIITHAEFIAHQANRLLTD